MIHLIVGNTGSGKTTYANDLRKQNRGVVFSIDKWNKTLFLPDKKPTDGLEWFLERIERAEALMSDLIEQLENSGTDSILDLGLSKVEHRQKFRIFAAEKGIELTTHFLDIPTDVRLNRIHRRNKEQGSTFEFEVSDEDFEFMEAWFEPPSDEEMQGGIVITA